jgi:hypothetical protein
MTKIALCAGALCVAGLALGSCVTSPTTRPHLFGRGDPLRYQNAAVVPETWAQATFDDGPWPASTGRIAPLRLAELGDPAPVWTRARFDVGARAAAFEELTLSVSVEAPFVAYLNGARVATASGPITVPPGVLRPSGNVLALEVRPPRGMSGLEVGVVIDGAPRPTSSRPELVRGPWVLAPTPTSVTVVWETSVPAPSTLVLDGRRIDGGAGAHHAVTVRDLAPSSAYRYRVEVEGAAPSEEAQVVTAPLPGASERVRFVVYGDNRSNGDAHRRVVSAIAAEGADFLLNTGDLVDHDADDEWQTFFDIEHALLSTTPLWAAPGNHEGGGDRWAELFPVGERARFAGRAYGADYGPVHVAALDSNGDLVEQARWLDGDLAAARARGAKHLFVFMHDGPFSGATGFGAHGSNMIARRVVVPVAKKHGVTAIFSGHDHIYERGESDDLAYWVTGGGGAPLRSAGFIDETKVAKSLFHYLVVDVVGGRAQITAKDTTGTPFDEATIVR